MKTRIQVSIHPDLVEIAEQNMAVRKFSSFSAYLEMLIREEYTRGQQQPLNSATSPAFGAIFDAAFANARAAQSAPLASVQPVSHSTPPKTKPSRRTSPQKK